MKGEFLNKKRVKKINEKLKEYYNAIFDIDNYFFILRKKDLYVISKDIILLEDFDLKDVSSGLYIGELYDDNFLRLSIEGTQLLKFESDVKNVISLDDCSWKQWLMKMDIVKEEFKNMNKAFYIVRHFNNVSKKYDYFGVGLLKEGKLHNYIPKNRAVKEFH